MSMTPSSLEGAGVHHGHGGRLGKEAPMAGARGDARPPSGCSSPWRHPRGGSPCGSSGVAAATVTHRDRIPIAAVHLVLVLPVPLGLISPLDHLHILLFLPIILQFLLNPHLLLALLLTCEAPPTQGCPWRPLRATTQLVRLTAVLCLQWVGDWIGRDRGARGVWYQGREMKRRDAVSR